MVWSVAVIRAARKRRSMRSSGVATAASSRSYGVVSAAQDAAATSNATMNLRTRGHMPSRVAPAPDREDRRGHREHDGLPHREVERLEELPPALADDVERHDAHEVETHQRGRAGQEPHESRTPWRVEGGDGRAEQQHRLHAVAAA